MKKRMAKRTMSLLLSMIMILGCMSACFGVIASALEWQFIDGASYDPVTVYVQTTSLKEGETYLLGLNDPDQVLNGVNQTVTRTQVSRDIAGTTSYFTKSDGSDESFVTSNYFVADESNVAFVNHEFTWQNSNLYNAATKKYLTNNGTTNVRMYTSAGKWTFSNQKLSMTVSSRTRYIRWSASNNAVQLSTTDSANTVYPYEKTVVYKKVAADAGSYYKYVGETDFAVDYQGTFDEKSILNSILILHKDDGENTPDEDCARLTIEDPQITFSWNEEVDVNSLDNFTGTVYVYGKPVQTLTVHVQDHSAATNGSADPSTSAIEDRFPLISQDDGKIASDKTVQYGRDEFDAFAAYAGDQFSVTLSALGQSFSPIETEEVGVIEKVHPDVVFIIDASGSMRVYNVAGEEICRGEATAIALNSAIKELYATDPETRIGIVTYGFDVDEGVYLPLDKYTLPEGQTEYVTWGGRMVASTGTGGFSSSVPYDTMTVSSSETVSGIKTTSKYPGITTSGSGSSVTTSYWQASPSDCTTIATVNGRTYYAISSHSTIYIYDNLQENPLCRMQNNPASNYYTKYYFDDNISITCTGSTSITYTTNTYTAKTGNIKLSFQEKEYMMATNFLINSNGEVVRPSCYHFVGNIGTFTQAGLQAAEDMFKTVEGDIENRAPAIVLLSDGIPTVGNTDTQNPGTKTIEGVTTGHGMSTSPVKSQELCNYGLYLIETAMKVKENVNTMYQNEQNYIREALFYTIGPGVDYIFGQTILNPTNENIELAAEKTTNVGEDTESGVGVPSDLAATITAKYTDLDYVDYADWSYTGDMSSEELNIAFRKIVTSILDIERPMTTITSGAYGSEEVSGAMVFTDVIGDGMQIESDFIVRYGNTNYAPTDIKEETMEDGTVVKSFHYDYRVVEQSTKKAYNLKGLTVQAITRADGTQMVKWYIPAELVPIIFYDAIDEVYVPVSPIRLIYQVGLIDEEMKGDYYTNSTEEPANVQYIPSTGNPYYYDVVLGDDNKLHSVLKDNTGDIARKTKNITGTSPYSRDSYMDDDGVFTTELGNNGLISILLTHLSITKLWDDGQNITGQRPDHITVQIYRNGYAYGEPRVITADDCDVYHSPDGTDTWSVLIKGLPYSPSFDYTLGEYEIPDHTSYITKQNDDITITNSLIRSDIEYDLYLVDKFGNPINENGDIVPFEDRIEMTDVVKSPTYIHTTDTIDIEDIQKILPEGYYVYNPETSFTETFEGVGSELNKATLVDNEVGTTKISVPETAEVGEDGTVSGLGDFSNIHLSFAIVKIEIKPDVVVVDYGKTITISPLLNDAGAIRLVGLNSIKANESDPVNKRTITTQNGVFRVEGDDVTFTPFSYMSSINRVKYSAELIKTNSETEILESTIFVIPATTVYYEDDFGGSVENGGLYIEYTGDWYNVTDDGEKTAQLEANTDLSDRQDRGEVGDGHVPYGYDSSYSECTQFSNGSATMVEGTVDLVTKEYNAYAEFYFTGTGFDIISRTDLDCGMISVYITDEDGEFVSNVPVINKGVENLYQIPVISYTGLPYGTYKVRINVNAPMGVLGITGSTFYLDAIRVYDPMGLSNRDNSEFNEANAAYSTDKEANAYVASIRDYILAIEKLGVDEESGAVYVDTIDNDYTAGGVLKQDAIEDFHITGPNEEVYLTPGKGIGFALVCSDLPESVQLEIKIPAPLKNSASLRAQTNGVGSSAKEINVQSATEMFYDITDAVQFVKVTLPEGNYYRAVVVLTNGLINASESEIVSITNVKMTYNNKVKNIVETKDGNQIASFAESTTVIDGDGNVVEDPTQVAVGVMASWDIYCDVFDTIYTQHQATIPTYDVAVSKNFDKVSYGEKSTAVFTSSQFVDDLIVTDENGNKVNAYITSDVDEDNLYTASYGSAKTWTVTVAASEGEHTYSVKAANGEGSAADANVEVEASKIVSLKVLNAPAKTKYNYGDTIDTTGLVLEATYSDGTVKQIKSGYTISDYKADHAGNRTVKVYYNGAEASFRINVKVTFAQIILTIFGFGWLWKK